MHSAFRGAWPKNIAQWDGTRVTPIMGTDGAVRSITDAGTGPLVGGDFTAFRAQKGRTAIHTCLRRLLGTGSFDYGILNTAAYDYGPDICQRVPELEPADHAL